MAGYVLIGGWPASGKTTLARALAPELGFTYLAKDDIKEALMDVLGVPSDVESSRTLGRAAVHATLRAARECRPAVLDSTWFPESLPLVHQLEGPFVEIRCRAPLELVRRRYRVRARDSRHLDHVRDEHELWGQDVAPLGVGPLLEVDTAVPVDTPAVADHVRRLLGPPLQQHLPQ